MAISLEDFTAELEERPLEEIVKAHLFDGDPFVFRAAPDQYAVLRRHIAGGLKVEAGAITIVGSAKIGFSLDPNSFGRAFSKQSDVDVVVVSERLFDAMWQALIAWRYRRPNRLHGLEQGWGAARRDDVFWGWFTPHKIRYTGLSFPAALKPLRDISTLWFQTFRTTALYPGLQGRDYNGRLYRTWDHAMQYHGDGLRIIRSNIQGQGTN